MSLDQLSRRIRRFIPERNTMMRQFRPQTVTSQGMAARGSASTDDFSPQHQAAQMRQQILDQAERADEMKQNASAGRTSSPSLPSTVSSGSIGLGTNQAEISPSRDLTIKKPYVESAANAPQPQMTTSQIASSAASDPSTSSVPSTTITDPDQIPDYIYNRLPQATRDKIDKWRIAQKTPTPTYNETDPGYQKRKGLSYMTQKVEDQGDPSVPFKTLPVTGAMQLAGLSNPYTGAVMASDIPRKLLGDTGEKFENRSPGEKFFSAPASGGLAGFMDIVGGKDNPGAGIWNTMAKGEEYAIGKPLDSLVGGNYGKAFYEHASAPAQLAADLGLMPQNWLPGQHKMPDAHDVDYWKLQAPDVMKAVVDFAVKHGLPLPATKLDPETGKKVFTGEEYYEITGGPSFDLPSTESVIERAIENYAAPYSSDYWNPGDEQTSKTWMAANDKSKFQRDYDSGKYAYRRENDPVKTLKKAQDIYIAPKGADWKAYLTANPDVAAVAATTTMTPEEFAQFHYYNYGKDEGRSPYAAGVTKTQAEEAYLNKILADAETAKEAARVKAAEDAARSAYIVEHGYEQPDSAQWW